MLLIIVQKLSCNEESEESEEDTVVELKNLRTELISRLDHYLRIQSTQKRYNYNTEHEHGVRYGIWGTQLQKELKQTTFCSIGYKNKNSY